MPAADPSASLRGRTILQVVPALDAGGVERTTVDVSAAVAHAGARSLVVSAGGRMEAELGPGVEARRLPLESRSPLTVAANTLALRRLIVRERVDLVHARSRLPAWAALWAARRTGAALVTTYAGIYNARSALKRGYNGVMARGDRVIANSAFTRDHLLAEHGADPARVVAIPRGLDLARFDPAAVSPERVAAFAAALKAVGAPHAGVASPGRVTLLLAGRLTAWKGQALAIEALAAAVSQGADLALVLAGDAQGRSGYVDALVRRAEALGVADRVAIPGHVPDMPAAYLACDVAIAPSLDPEAFGRTAAEPQAMGRPVLAADHGAARETVQDGGGGLLIPPGDVQAWTAAFRQAADWTPQERRAMGEHGRAFVTARFSVQAMTAQTLAVYAEVLAERDARGGDGAR